MMGWQGLKKKDCAARIKQVYPKAEYDHCMSHDLNLAVTKSYKLPEMQVMLDTVNQVGILLTQLFSSWWIVPLHVTPYF